MTDFPTRGKGTVQRRRLCSGCYRKRRRASWNKHDALRNQQRRDRWTGDIAYRERNRESGKRYRDAHAEELAARRRGRYRALKARLIEMYGGACECCQESRIEFLTIDHVNGGGTQERAALTARGVFQKLLAVGSRLNGYRLLCWNCNAAWAFYETCPHQARVAVAL